MYIVESEDSFEAAAAVVTGSLNGSSCCWFCSFGRDDFSAATSLLPDDMFRDNAQRRVKLGLVLAELIAHHELKADPDALRSAIEEIASTYQDPEEVVNWYYSNQEQLAAVESKVLEDSVVEKLLESANVNDEPCSYQDAIALGQQANR